MGLDPGTRTAGYGLVEAAGTRLRYLEAGVLRGDPDAPLEQRLATIAAGLAEVCERWQPGSAAVEDLFVKADPRAALAVGHGRGALLAVLGRHRIPVHSYPPASIKRTLTGSGRATKDRVAKMVATLLALEASDLAPDASDALAAAITHAFTRKTQTFANK
ncbi:MAG: crossover junction endodeoxyribonuclease RuvC [Planctomycetota bacterium]